MSSACRAAAFRFLKIRPRSVQELREKLAGKGYPKDEIEPVLDHLLAVDLLNDRVFADGWVRYRLARPFGFRRITTELKDKGIAPEVIEEAVCKAKEFYAEPDVVLDVARRRWERLGNIDVQKKKKRVFDFLVRRGFSLDAVIKTMKKI